MKSGRLIYRCKKCNKIEFSEIVSDLREIIAYTIFNTYGQSSKYILHGCDDTSIGICELIGGEFEE